jgi:hypothetical protein
MTEAGWAAAHTNGSIFQRKFHRWVKKMGKQKADVAITHSLLRVVHAVLKEECAYRAPDPKQMHELERSKLIRHHSKRLRELGADDELINQITAKLVATPKAGSTPALEPALPTLPPLPRISRLSPAKACRGALGFRARQTRPQRYSVIREQSAGAPCQGRPPSKRAKLPQIRKPHTE